MKSWWNKVRQRYCHAGPGTRIPYLEQSLYLKRLAKTFQMYRLYVIELRKTVYTEHRKFREANPQFNGVNECLYVGMTSKTPKVRFEQHKRRETGQKGQDLSSSIVLKYGTFLRPSLYQHLPSYATREEALVAEKQLALRLRRERFAVWVN